MKGTERKDERKEGVKNDKVILNANKLFST